MEPTAAIGLLTVIGVGALTMGYANKETAMSDEREFTVSTKVRASNHLEAVAEAVRVFSGKHDAVISITTENVGTWSINPAGHPHLFDRQDR